MFTQRLSVNIKCSMRMITLITHYTRFNYLIIKTNQNLQTVIKYNFIFKGEHYFHFSKVVRYNINNLSFSQQREGGGLSY